MSGVQWNLLEGTRVLILTVYVGVPSWKVDSLRIQQECYKLRASRNLVF